MSTLYLQQSKSRGRTYLSFVQGYRQDGKVKHKTIEKLGYLDELQKEYDDPVAFFKAEARRRNAEIPALEKIEINTGEILPEKTGLRKNLGYCIPKAVYSELDCRSFFQNKQRCMDVKFNLDQVFRLLVFNRFMFPASKRRAYDERDRFFERAEFSLDDTYRALRCFEKLSLPLQKFLHKRVSALIGREPSQCFYDVTNYYFEIPYNDEDTTAEDGSVKRGFRERGPSKEHRPDPIVQMGLLMDSNGIPVAFNVFPGNDSEKTSLLPTVHRVKSDYGIDRIVIVADRGLNTSDNTAFLSGINDDNSHGDGYVYGQSVIGADQEFRKWTLDQKGYISDELPGDEPDETIIFRHKSRIFAKKIQLKGTNGKRTKTMCIYQKQMVYYSRKYADKQKKERERVLAKARDLIANPGRYTRATSYGATAYIKNLSFVKDTGEIATGRDLSLDTKKIEEEEKYDGYYSIVTSEKNMSDIEIRDTYKGLWRIEESFKVIKHEFRARPVYLRKEEHIKAHFLICFMALLLMRIIEIRLGRRYPFSTIRQSLVNCSCTPLEQNYYLCDYRDECIIAMEKEFGIDLSHKYLSLKDIKKIFKHTKAEAV